MWNVVVKRVDRTREKLTDKFIDRSQELRSIKGLISVTTFRIEGLNWFIAIVSKAWFIVYRIEG